MRAKSTPWEVRSGIFKSAANGVITVDADDYADKMNVYKELLLKEDSIKSNLTKMEWIIRPDERDHDVHRQRKTRI